MGAGWECEGAGEGEGWYAGWGAACAPKPTGWRSSGAPEPEEEAMG